MRGLRHVHLRDLQHEGCDEVQDLRRQGDVRADLDSMTDTVDFSPLGIVIGHAADAEGARGCTVIRPVTGALLCGGVHLGRATASREFALASPSHSSSRIDAVFLTGGSAYGLDAAAGVMRWMEERGRGFAIAGGVVPLVPAAAIFDLGLLASFTIRPTADMAYRACDSATPTPAEGSVGAGTGATVGKAAGGSRAMKGGFGAWVVRSGDLVVGAVAVTNAFGDIRDAQGKIIAGARGEGGTFLDATKLLIGGAPRRDDQGTIEHTTLGLVATNAQMSRVELQQLASASTAAFFRRITPCATSYDGDTIFAVGPQQGLTASAVAVEALAVQAMEMAIERSVRLAKGRNGVPGLSG
ncbi:MAG: P1 family peptidase [Gemmatimonadaceae bacterium]